MVFMLMASVGEKNSNIDYSGTKRYTYFFFLSLSLRMIRRLKKIVEMDRYKQKFGAVAPSAE